MPIPCQNLCDTQLPHDDEAGAVSKRKGLIFPTEEPPNSSFRGFRVDPFDSASRALAALVFFLEIVWSLGLVGFIS